jgi:hypothetical protein
MALQVQKSDSSVDKLANFYGEARRGSLDGELVLRALCPSFYRKKVYLPRRQMATLALSIMTLDSAFMPRTL